jgi:hypothetical protein
VSSPDAAEWRYLRAACAVVALLVVAQVGGWLVYRSVHSGPTPLGLTEKCLRREKRLTVGPATAGIAATARGGALATRVEEDGVVVLFATSDREAAELAAEYRRTEGRRIDLRLEVRGRVVYVWEEPKRPTVTQRQTMYDCWYD